MRKSLAGLVAAAAVATGVAAQQVSDNWRERATRADQGRINRLDQSWAVGVREARRSDAVAVARLGAVARPSAALARPHPTPGNYRCRTIKLGSSSGDRGFIAYDWFACRVALDAGGNLSLRKTTGSQRPSGELMPLGARRLAFLGTLALSSSERSWPRYGAQQDRDIAGVFERIGTNHYRLLMPEPAYESELDILELRRR